MTTMQKIIILGGCLTMCVTACSSEKKEPAAISISGEHICISLVNLMKEVHKQAGAGGAIPEDITHLGGISWLEGYVVDTKNSDIILYGKKMPNRPPYQLGDLIDNYKNVFENNVDPYCSLDPKPENILRLNHVLQSKTYADKDMDGKAALLSEAIGGQMTVVGGVPRNSNHAFVMIDADYHMKKVSQGLVKLPGITSCIDLIPENAKNEKLEEEGDKMSMSRFWFHIKPNDKNPYPNFMENDNIVQISECPVVLLTERQVADKKGKLSDDKKENPIARQFAQNMTENFSKSTESVKSYAELENLFRLHALMKAAKFRLQNSPQVENVNLVMNKVSYSSNNVMPESLPGLVNMKEYKEEKKETNKIITKTKLFMVCGGVGMNMKVEKENLTTEVKLTKFQNKVVQLRPDNDAYTWKVTG
jgi:hypothetical protein